MPYIWDCWNVSLIKLHCNCASYNNVLLWHQCATSVLTVQRNNENTAPTCKLAPESLNISEILYFHLSLFPVFLSGLFLEDRRMVTSFHTEDDHRHSYWIWQTFQSLNLNKLLYFQMLSLVSIKHNLTFLYI